MEVKINQKNQELINKANAEITRLKEWFEEHKEAFEYMDLKLHDVSWYCAKGYNSNEESMETEFPLCSANDNDGNGSYFYLFCDSSYDQFTDWCSENGIDFNKMRNQLGRTSSFWLHNDDVICMTGRGYAVEWDASMETIMNNLYGYNNWIWYKKDGFIDIEKTYSDNDDFILSDKEDILQHISNELEYIATEMFADVINHYEDMLKVYEYLKDFKANQVEYFKEWLQYYEDELVEDKRKEDEETEKRNDIISKMPHTIQPIMSRSGLDSENLGIVLDEFNKHM